MGLIFLLHRHKIMAKIHLLVNLKSGSNRGEKSLKQIPILTDEAIRQAYARKGPAVIIIPKDYGWQKATILTKL